MKKRRSWILKLEEIQSYQFLRNPRTESESDLVRILIKILSRRESLIKLFDLRILSTLLLRDLRKSNPYFLIKGVVVLTFLVLIYNLNHKSSMIERKNFYSMKLFPIHINVMELGNETSKESFKPFTKNWFIFPHLFLSFQLKRSYNRSTEHYDLISVNSGYDRNMIKKDEMISGNQGRRETPLEKDEKDINSKINSTFNSTENEYWEPEKYLCEDPFTRNKTEIEQQRENLILWDLSFIERKQTKIESDLSSKCLEESSPISWTKEYFTEDKRDIEDNLFPKKMKIFIDNFTKSIRYSFFYILPIDEPCMGGLSATKKPIEDFNLFKRQQYVFSQDFRDSKLMNSIVDLWKIQTYFEIENTCSNCAISSDPGCFTLIKPSYMNRSVRSIKRKLTLPWNLSSAFCDQSKGQYILHNKLKSKTKKIVLKMTDQFTLSITKPSQVHYKFSFDMDYRMNPLYELNKNGSLRSNRIFHYRDKLKNQSLWGLLNITDKEDEYLEKRIDKELCQIDFKNRLEIGTPLNDYRTKAFNWYESIRYKISGYSENLFNRFYFMNRSSRSLKDQFRTNWIEIESLNNVTKDTIDRHSSSWRKSQREWFNRSIIRTDKHINWNLNVYKWSNQTEHFLKCLKPFFSKKNYFQIVFNPIESCTNTNKDSIGWSLSKKKKDYSKFSFLSESTMKILNSKFDIISKLNSKFDILFSLLDFRFRKLKSINSPLLNELLNPIDALIVDFKTLKSFILDDHNLSKRSNLLIDEGTIAFFFSNEIPINPFIIYLFNNENNRTESFDNTYFSAISNDRDNWLNPIKLSYQSSLKASFHGANTLRFFDYFHNSRSNYRKRLPFDMKRIHIKKKNLTYGQLFNLLPIHNNLSSLPIGEIGPVHSEKDTISLIKSQVSNVLLPQYLQRKRRGDQTFVLIYYLYRSFNLLTRLNPFVHDKRYLSSIEEISTTPLTKEKIVNLEKTFCQSFLNRSDSEENNLDQYPKKGFSSNMGLIQTRSYQDDLLSEIFPNKNQEMFHRIQDWFGTESSKNIIGIGNRGIDERSTRSNSSKEERKILSSPCFNELVKKQEMYRIFRIDSFFSKWDLLQTYMPWFFTSAWCKYIENMLLDTLPEILLHGSNKIVSIFRDIKHNFLFQFNILWEPIQLNKLSKFLFLKNSRNEFLSFCGDFFMEETSDREKSSAPFIWAHLRLLNVREYEYGVLIPFFVLGYSVLLQYFQVISSTFINLKIDFKLIKYLKNPSYAIELQKKLMIPPCMPSIPLPHIDIWRGGTFQFFPMKMNIKMTMKMKDRKLNSVITRIRKLNKLCSSMDLYEKEIELLVQFLITEKNISQIESNLTYSHNFLKNEFCYKITEQPGLIHLQYLVYTYQKDLMNYEFDPFFLVERWVFLAFCQKITSSQRLCQTNPTFNATPFSLHSGSLLSKGLLLIGPMGTGRSYLVQGLAADSYVPLIRISLKKFLSGNYLNYSGTEGRKSDFDTLVKQKIKQLNLTLKLAKRMSPCIIWIPSIHELNVNDLTSYSFLGLGFTEFLLGLLVNHLSRDDEKEAIKNILVIAPTHIPQKVDPALIAPNRLDRSINIRMLVIPQRQREFPMLLCSKGVYSEKELSCPDPDEIGSRTMGSDPRDLAALANEAFLISITRNKSVIDTNTIRSALYRQTFHLKSMNNQVGFGQKDERLIYKVGKAVIQNTLRRNSPMNLLSTKKDLWKKRFCYLSEWYLEPSIAETTMKELTILPHILGCLAGSAARDSWSISERNRDNLITLDTFAEHDLALASSLLESLLMEFPQLGICRGKSDKDQITFAPQPKRINHLDMVRFLKEYELKFLQETLGTKEMDRDMDMDEELSNNMVWTPRIWRLSFLRSNRFVCTKRPNSLGSSYQFGSFKKGQIGRSKISIQYPMQYKSSQNPILFLGRRFLWDPFLFLFQFKEQHLVFSSQEFFVNEELLKRLYITYGSMRRTAKSAFFPKKRLQGVFRRYNSKSMTNSGLVMNSWKQLSFVEKEHIEDFKRIQAIGIRLERMQPYCPIFSYQRWLIENPGEKVDRFESLIHRQRWIGTNSLLYNESFLYNTLFESYQYLSNLFLSNRMLLDQMTKTLLEKKWLLPNEIENSIHTTGLKFNISRDNL
nr:Ycf2 protein [Cathaya argyrophylla]ULF47463.1 Ycf2 protein [Cathaya argyrophylla]ULF47559.1 Ycf2 protein [Cathaya argyrophylla]